MRIKKVCDLCGKGFVHPYFAHYWEDTVCFECVDDLDLFILDPENVIILPGIKEDGGHYGK